MKTVLLLAIFCITNICVSQNVEIPDQNFEKALIDLGIDSDEKVNGLVLKSDIVLVTSLDVSNKNIKDLTGIEEFSSLIYLNCRNNKLTNLDVSQNIGLIMLSTSVNHLIANENYSGSFRWFDD